MARNRLEIRLDLIRKNYAAIKSAVSPLVPMAVLKADAYGMGAVTVRDALKKEGCTKFGVADSNEAEEICDSESDIYILGDILPEEIPSIVEKNFIIPITSFENAELVNLEAVKQGKKVRVQVLLDTGMGRLGILIENAFDKIQKISKLQNLRLFGLYSHFPHAYGDKSFSDLQIDQFLQLKDKLQAYGVEFDEFHIANSDGIHNIKSAVMNPFNIARTGINLYGCFDLEGERTVALDPVIRLVSRLVAIRTLPAGHSIGYGRTYKLKEEKKIGTVAIGYADGLPIGLSNNGSLVIRGKRCPIVGRVSMDYTTVDISALDEVQIGDDVICLGDEIPVSEWAEAERTITYDIICSIGNRVQRVYKN